MLYFTLYLCLSSRSIRKKMTTFLTRYPESSQRRTRTSLNFRKRWYIPLVPFSWRQNTWCGKHIPLSCPPPYLAQVFLYTVIAPKCIVFSSQGNITETLSQCYGNFWSLLLWRRQRLQSPQRHRRLHRHRLAAELCLRYPAAL